MGCDCCNKWNEEEGKCTASQKYRDGWCGVNLRTKPNPNTTPKKKKRKKQPKKLWHKRK